MRGRQPIAVKLPPQAPELEQAVIGGCLLSTGALDVAAGMMEVDHFYVHAHQLIWQSMLTIHSRGGKADILTLTQQLIEDGNLEACGGPFYISQLSNKMASGANVEYHGRIVQEKYIRRKLNEVGQGLLDLDDTDDVFDTLDKANTMLAQVNAVPGAKDPVTVSSIIDGVVANRERPVYINMGMGHEFDKHVRMGPKNVVVIGARPSIGKTTFAVNACMNIAMDGHRVLFISLEMSEVELGSKIASILTGINSERITVGEITEDERMRIAEANVSAGEWLPRIFVEDLSSLKASQVLGIVQRAVKKNQVDLVVLDYLQCVEADGINPVDNMTKISRACKIAAKTTGVRLVELSQLKRRDGAEEDPQMSDLREAGQLEADGDIIIMLGRNYGGEALKCKIVKNKIGPVGVVVLPFRLSTQRIGTRFTEPELHVPEFSVRLPNPNDRIEPNTDDPPF